MRAFVAAVTPPSDAQVAQQVTTLVNARGRGKTICPSEVARALADDWRALMPQVRRVADDMAADGRLRITQKGTPVAAQQARGPIRLALSQKSGLAQEPD